MGLVTLPSAMFAGVRTMPIVNVVVGNVCVESVRVSELTEPARDVCRAAPRVTIHNLI